MRWKWIVGVVGALGMMGLVAGAIIAYAGGPPAGAQYVGGNKCTACHAKEHKAWLKTKHAKAIETLLPDELKVPECVKCHTTGYGKPGGFTDPEKTPALKNVGCEVCHGAGSAHIEAAKNAPDTGNWDKKTSKVPQNVCIDCHNPHIDRKEQADKWRAEHKK